MVEGKVFKDLYVMPLRATVTKPILKNHFEEKGELKVMAVKL